MTGLMKPGLNHTWCAARAGVSELVHPDDSIIIRVSPNVAELPHDKVSIAIRFDIEHITCDSGWRREFGVPSSIAIEAAIVSCGTGEYS